MAIILPPAFMQNRADHTAETDRSVMNALVMGPRVANSLVALGGVNMTLGGGLKVTQSGTPAMTVDIASGTCLVPGSEGAKQGCYVVVNDAPVTVTVGASSPSLPRIDLVVVQVRDQSYSGANNDAIFTTVPGTPASSPVAPSAPADSLILSQVLVGAGVTSILNGAITDTRYPVVLQGGIKPVANTTERATIPAYDGLAVYRKDTNWLEINDSVQYQVQGRVDVQKFTAGGTWNKPAGCRSVRVMCLGGGGGGGGVAATSAGQVAEGGGGGGGGYSEQWFDASLLSSAVAVTVGAGGSGGIGVDGGVGGSTTFSSPTPVVAVGGAGGLNGAATTTSNSTSSGAGGSGSGGLFVMVGADGGMGRIFALQPSYGNWGGASHLGGSQRSNASATTSGVTGGQYGGGGSGGRGQGAVAAQAGGNGSQGICIVFSYC